MNLRANPESKFLLKYLIIGIVCVAFGLWSIYDGFVRFPGQIPRAQAWGKLKSDIESGVLADEDRKAEWERISAENGWSDKELTEADSVAAIEGKIFYQYVFMALGFGLGIPCVIWYLRSNNSWIESTDDGLRSSNGQELKLSQITKFDKKKWEKKGIGVLHYTAKDGAERKFVVDDLKYDRQTTDKIVVWVESHLKPEMIVNGLPETIPSESETAQPVAQDEPETQV